MPNDLDESGAVVQAFSEYERDVRIQNYRIACLVALIFMPAGLPLDRLVYPERASEPTTR